MSSIYEKITVRFIDPETNLNTEETLTKVQFLRLMSNGANGETDEEIQQFFNTFHI